MRKYGLLVLMLFAMLWCSGCTQSLPSISHAHIGHALTAWHDTPENKGLLEVSEAEADNIMKELAMATEPSAAPCDVKYHVDNIVHSLNPTAQETGSGLGYGVVPSIQNVITHVEFAADSNDASENIKRSAESFVRHAKATSDNFLLALAQARYAASVKPSLIADQLPELELVLSQAVYGKDIDRDGVIGNVPDESGLVQLRSMMSDMVANEVRPPYQPIGKRYLLGLVRLPDGAWAYKLNNPEY